MTVRMFFIGCFVWMQFLVGTQLAAAHEMPWASGDSRMKGFGRCAKGPCQKRYNFADSMPHHHHGLCVVIGSAVHSPLESCADRARNLPGL